MTLSPCSIQPLSLIGDPPLSQMSQLSQVSQIGYPTCLNRFGHAIIGCPRRPNCLKPRRDPGLLLDFCIAL